MARILVVDDEPDVLLLLRMVLEDGGHDTLLAADGESAIERLDRDPVDLVLLDVCMPVMDGWSVLETIQARSSPPKVVIISARTQPGDFRRAIELGAVDYVPKPFDPDQLLAKVEGLVRTR